MQVTNIGYYELQLLCNLDLFSQIPTDSSERFHKHLKSNCLRIVLCMEIGDPFVVLSSGTGELWGIEVCDPASSSDTAGTDDLWYTRLL